MCLLILRIPKKKKLAAAAMMYDCIILYDTIYFRVRWSHSSTKYHLLLIYFEHFTVYLHHYEFGTTSSGEHIHYTLFRSVFSSIGSNFLFTHHHHLPTVPVYAMHSTCTICNTFISVQTVIDIHSTYIWLRITPCFAHQCYVSALTYDHIIAGHCFNYDWRNCICL